MTQPTEAEVEAAIKAVERHGYYGDEESAIRAALTAAAQVRERARVSMIDALTGALADPEMRALMPIYGATEDQGEHKDD